MLQSPQMSSPPVISELRGIGRRLKAMSVANGIALLIATAIAAILAIIAIDYFVHLPAAGRIVFLILALLAIAWLLIRRIALPVMQKISLPFLAARIEQAFPQFHDRLRSTVDFTAEQIPGSDAMKARVIAETNELFQQIDIRQAISRKPLYQSLTAAATALLAIILLAALVSPFYRQLALDRLLHPFAAPAWPKSVQIDLLDTLPPRIPVGQSLNIHMKLSRGDRPSRKAILFYQLDSGIVQQQYMNRQPDGSYTANLDTRLDTASTGKVRAWITAGDDTVQLHPVAIVPRLAVQSITLQIQPPAYTNLPPTTADLSAGPATATVGSHIILTAHFNKPLGSADPSIESLDSPAPKIQWTHSNLELRTQNLELDHSLRFHLHATDADGFSNAGAEEYQIIARVDQPPVIQIENPRRNEERTPEAVVPLQLSAADDFGISAITLHSTLHGATPAAPLQDLPLLTNTTPQPNVTFTKTESTPDQQRYRLDYPWPLANLNLSPGDTLEYHATAQDNFNLNGQRHAPVSSSTLRITIVSQQQLADHIAEQMRQIAQQVSQVRTAQTRTAQETQTLAHDTAQKPKLDSADRAMLDRLADQQGASAAETKQLSDRLAALVQQLQENRSPNDDLKQTATDAGNLLNQAAENAMKQSAGNLSQLRDSAASPSQRNEQLAQTLSQQNQAADQLQQALDRLGSASSLEQTISQIASLLKNQQDIAKQTSDIGQNNLGKTPDQMSPADQKRLAENAANQKSLADRTAAALAQMAKQSAALSQTDPSTSAALSQAASTADQQQITPSQQKAGDAITQNEQSDAQSSQAQAAIGLQTILSQLHDAQRAQLAELSRHLADLQAQLARLVRRQATHNLDNLTLQGSTAPKNIDRKTLDGLAASGSSEPSRTAASSSPSLPSLTTAQEQTHRNTRDIAAAADHLKGAADLATLLLQSADKMERAGVLLENHQLAPAYDPPQSDALSLLLASQKKLDTLKSQLDQQLAAQNRQTLRDAYIKIKADQQTLNDRTTAIDHSPRLPDGSLNRISAINLSQLPPAQTQLANRIAELNDPLGSLGGIVYLWVNNDIHDTMTAVASDLRQESSQLAPVLGPGSISAAQQKIIANLDAMIQSLATEPKKNEFAQRDSGGGGSGKQNSKPQLPPEAELRLLKQFEQNLKTQTAAADQTHAPAQSLSALGNRQREFRTLLNQLLQKSSQGQIQLPPDPENKPILPEEKNPAPANPDDLAQQLLTDPPATDTNTDQSIPLLGTRMSRAAQRLALNHDPSQTTQTIQQNILAGLDNLIQQARQQQSQSSPQNQQQQDAQQNPQITKNPSQQPSASSTQTPAHASSPARSSNVTGSAQIQTSLNDDIHQNMRQWGGLSDRQRQAVLEGASDTVIEKYKTLVDDYYRDLAEKK
jgi:hypothetical protein